VRPGSLVGVIAVATLIVFVMLWGEDVIRYVIAPAP
jgi:hypothetical protein